MARKNNRRNKRGGEGDGVAKVEDEKDPKPEDPKPEKKVEEVEEKKGGVIDAIGNFMTGKTNDSKLDKEASGAEHQAVTRLKEEEVISTSDTGQQTLQFFPIPPFKNVPHL